MKTIGIKGLCLGGNKGGPAILTSLLSLLKEFIPSFNAVVISSDMEQDIPWKEYYNVALVPLPKTKEIWKHFSMYRACDLVIDMHGVKFLGPMKTTAIASSAYPIIIPRLLGIPCVCFTQTYGPFKNYITEIAAKFTLNSANLVFAREQESMKLLGDIGLGHKSKLYPDVALAMPSADVSDLSCSTKVLDFINEGTFIGVSLSSMVILEEKKAGVAPKYEKMMGDFLQSLINSGNRILFIPHSVKPASPDEDDLGLSQRIQGRLQNTSGRSLVVEDDLPPDQLKTLISKSVVLIGSRYHSLVAALSTAVPVLSIGWSHKYDGLLDLFEMKQFSTWSNNVSADELPILFSELIKKRNSYSSRCRQLLPTYLEAIRDSVREVTSLLKPL